MARFFVGITGASGHVYAEALIRSLVASGMQVDLCVTSAGAKVLRHELGIVAEADCSLSSTTLLHWLGEDVAQAIRVFAPEAVEAPAASGTSLTGGVILCPCSMGTMARVAAGFSSNLVERAADVALKEGRRLLIVPREAPYSEIHLENMLRLARMGAVILPASPGFYHGPQNIADLVDHLVGKMLDRMEVEHSLGKRWAGLAPVAADEGVVKGVDS
ncbi:MAG: 4-hydroxy-3-polyprenylbenzoate decarboxylase [Planctomycetota bacterium]|jgi:4-hydroxy-3-polyprenylbenzoate decarboxylase